MEKIDKDKLTEEQSTRYTYALNSIFRTLSTTDYTFTADAVELMMKDLDIKAAIDQRKRGVNQRIAEVTGEGAIQENLQSQLNDLNLVDVIDVIIDSKFRGYTVQEIIYNDDLTIAGVKEKPTEWYTQRWNEDKKEYEWILNYGGSGVAVENA